MKRNWTLVIAALSALALVACSGSQQPDKSGTEGGTQPTEESKPVETERGKIVLELDSTKAPKTVAQITRLIKSGFYDGQRIHRVEDWVIQWGDPQSKQDDFLQVAVGTQGSGNPLDFEDSGIPHIRGVLSMASTGERVGGDSQMFILRKDSQFLDGNYASFGKVLEGMDVVDNIQQWDKVYMKVDSEEGGKVKVTMTVTFMKAP